MQKTTILIRRGVMPSLANGCNDYVIAARLATFVYSNKAEQKQKIKFSHLIIYDYKKLVKTFRNVVVN